MSELPKSFKATELMEITGLARTTLYRLKEKDGWEQVFRINEKGTRESHFLLDSLSSEVREMVFAHFGVNEKPERVTEPESTNEGKERENVELITLAKSLDCWLAQIAWELEQIRKSSLKKRIPMVKRVWDWVFSNGIKT